MKKGGSLALRIERSSRVLGIWNKSGAALHRVAPAVQERTWWSIPPVGCL